MQGSTNFSSDREIEKAMAINALAANFGKSFQSELLNMWLELLQEYSPEQVKQACLTVIKTYTYKTLPPFAVLKQELDKAYGADKNSIELQAVAEWGLLCKNLARYGRYNEPDLHETTAYTLRLMGGWGNACSWEESTLDFKRRDFIKLWCDSYGKEAQMSLGASELLQTLGLEAKQTSIAE